MPTILSLLGSTICGFLFCVVAAFCFILTSLLLGVALVAYTPVILAGKIHGVFK